MKTIGVAFAGLALVAGSVATAQQPRRPGPAAKAAARPAAKAAARPAEPPAAKPAAADQSRADDEKAIRAVVDAFAQSYNAGDAKKLAALFTPDAHVEQEDGTVVTGREAITEAFAQSFAEDPRPTIALKPDSIAFLASDVAFEEGQSTLKRGETDDAPEIGRYTVLYVKRDGQWLQARVRELPAEPAEPTPHDRLKELEWLVGDWVNESGDSIVRTTCEWAEGGAFLLRSFTIQIAGQPAMTGTQRIGWDPLRKQFRSWIFDSEGGFAEGLWSRDGDRWIVTMTGVTNEGRTASATQIVTYVNQDSSTWTSVHRTVDGETLPDIDVIRLVRRPPQPGSPASNKPSPDGKDGAR
jgi:uncharacterized protein (TIGR02246 family)